MAKSIIMSNKELVSVKTLGQRKKFNSFNQGSVMQAGRKIYQVTCLQCSQNFDGVMTARYCSNACRQKAYRKSKK